MAIPLLEWISHYHEPPNEYPDYCWHMLGIVIISPSVFTLYFTYLQIRIPCLNFFLILLRSPNDGRISIDPNVAVYNVGTQMRITILYFNPTIAGAIHNFIHIITEYFFW